MTRLLVISECRKLEHRNLFVYMMRVPLGASVNGMGGFSSVTSLLPSVLALGHFSQEN